SKGEFHNNVWKAIKKARQGKVDAQKYKYIWYFKQAEDDEKAYLEVIAQELFRLVISEQPKTRWVKTDKGKLKYVVSKEVPNYRKFTDIDPYGLLNVIKSGYYRGLASIAVMAMFVDEIDLGNHNLGRNEDRQVIKIDGDRCFD